MAEYWLPLAFHDCALIHCLIGCADVYVSGYTTIKDESRGLRHLTTAISIVNQRFIDHKDLMSIGTLAVIAGIALLEVRTTMVEFPLYLTIGTRKVQAVMTTGGLICKA